MEKINTILLRCSVLISAFCLISCNQIQNRSGSVEQRRLDEYIVKENYTENISIMNQLPFSITCKINYYSQISLEPPAVTVDPSLKQEFIYSQPQQKSKAVVFRFSELNLRQPKMENLGGFNSTYKTRLTKVVDDHIFITMIEKGPNLYGDFNIYSIHKSSGVLLWSIHYEATGRPLVGQSMGNCY
jgi:hypothetical protein